VAAPTFRPATLDDAPLAADLMTAAYPALEHDPVMTRFRWEHQRVGFRIGRYIAALDGRPIAFLAWLHGPWEKKSSDRHCEVEVWLDRALLETALLTTMWTWIEDQALAEGPNILMAVCAEDEPEMLAVLAGLGYRRDRTDRVWELDLKAHGARLVEQAKKARERASADEVEMVTLAEWNDADKMVKLHELDARTRQDIPSTFPIPHESLADFVRRTNGPDRPHDRYWVAVHQGRPVALSYLRFPPVRGAVWTGYTCSHPDYRGRGLARAVKLQSLAQAVALGVPLVGTDNDAENAPMLHINQTLGYRLRPGYAIHLKRVDK
jgi:RimJ/RimL family protein N-acetyltransferase